LRTEKIKAGSAIASIGPGNTIRLVETVVVIVPTICDSPLDWTSNKASRCELKHGNEEDEGKEQRELGHGDSHWEPYNGGVQPVPGDWVIVQSRLATGTRLQRMVRRFEACTSRLLAFGNAKVTTDFAGKMVGNLIVSRYCGPSPVFRITPPSMVSTLTNQFATVVHQVPN